MPVPKRKRSRARRDSRFADKGLKPKAFTSCSQCEAPLAPHQACKSCGYYKGNKVLATKVDRVVRRAEHKQAQATEQKTAESSPE